MRKEELLQKLSFDDAFKGFTPHEPSRLWGWNNDTPIFKKLISELRPKTIIEVGTWLGASAVHMHNLTRELGLDTGIICIDTWLGSLEHWDNENGRREMRIRHGFPTLYESFLTNILSVSAQDSIVPLPMPSLIAGRFLKDKKISAELIYIDGSHNEKDVYDDLCTYWEVLGDGGIMFGDDWSWPGVRAAVTKFSLEQKIDVVLDTINWVLHKPSNAKKIPPILTSSSSIYREPELTYLVLDYCREKEAVKCLESIKTHTKFPHKVIYLHNGNGAEYPYELFKRGLIDQFIQTKGNNGLGIGTRDLFAASFSPYSFYLQNDQYLTRDFTQEEFEKIKKMIDAQYVSPHDDSHWTARSVDLAGGVCGVHTYSERGHIIKTDFYKELENELPLSFHGAGPWHDGEWREGQLQRYYRDKKFLHYTYEHRMVENSGHVSVRENPDGSVWGQEPLSRKLRLISGPVRQKNIYPPLTNDEWDEVLRTQTWPEWQIPQNEKGQSIIE